MTGLSFPSFASECKRDDRPRRAFCAGAFLIAFFPRDTLFCLHTAVSYPDLMVACTDSPPETGNKCEK